MGRQTVIQVSCDRCKRVEHRPLSEAKGNVKDGDKTNYMFRGTYKGECVEFEDLCSGCETILETYWSKISKQLQTASRIQRKNKR